MRSRREMLISFLLIAEGIIGIAGVTGCSNTSSSYTPPAASPVYSLSAENVQKLRDVGCDGRDSKFTCENEAAADNDASNVNGKLGQLQSIRGRVEKQQRAVDEVLASVRRDLKSGNFSAAPAAALEMQLVSTSADLSTRLAGLDVKIVEEKNYQIVLGYHCEGGYTREKVPVLTKADLLNALAGETKETADEGAAYFASLQVSKEHAMIYRMTDARKAADQTARAYVETDGEFAAQTFSRTETKMNCAHSRAAGSTLPFSDRVEQMAYYACRLTSTFKGKATHANYSFGIGDKADGANFDILAIEAIDQQMQDRPEGRGVFQQYVAHVSSTLGIFKISIENLAEKRAALEFSSPNATKRFRLNVDDGKTNIFDLDCSLGRSGA